MPRPATLPPEEERLLSARECAERAHVHPTAWWGIARDSMVLRRGRVRRGRGTYWLASAVGRYLRSLAGTSPRVVSGEAGRRALAARRAMERAS